MDAIEKIRTFLRSLIRHVAIAADRVSQSRITPDIVTLTSLLLHIFIAWLIVSGLLAIAAAALVVFGLFDTLDGELARVQQRESNWGMIFDATSDRLKEGLLYLALGLWFLKGNSPQGLLLAFAALISSYSVSYIKAKAETVVASTDLSAAKANKIFSVGLARYELRMAILVMSLLFNTLTFGLSLIAALSLFTLFQRAIIIRQAVD